jgi:endonuclease/exonuclease/phosphatase family metal-dependent hydrolase
MHQYNVQRLIAALLVGFLSSVGLAQAQESFITIDEDFSDWEAVEPLFEAGDPNRFFQRVQVTNNDRYLFLSLEVAPEVVLQNSGIVLYIDSDNDAETGLNMDGIGVDLEWRFGERVGFIHRDGFALEIQHPTIGVVNAPTVSSTRFEIALRRDAMYGLLQLFDHDDIQIVFGITESGVVGEFAALAYTFRDVQRPRPPVSLARPDSTDLRVVSYNVLRDGPLLGRDSYFTRILSAIQPDIIGFQEVYASTAEFVEWWLERDLPGEGQWFVEKAANDVILASRFPIIDVESVWHHDQFAPRTGAFLLDLRPTVESDLLVYVTHTACCENNLIRQEHLDGMMAHLRDKQDVLPRGTPFMLIGDFNLVTFESQRRTVIYGEISDNTRYGPSFEPDWDGSPLADLKPPVTGLPMTFTWYDRRSDFSPGRLDYIFYSDHALTALNGYTLFTSALLESERAMYGLHEGDTDSASDHLPLVGDFLVNLPETGTSAEFFPDRSALSVEVYPNPASERTTLSIGGHLESTAQVSLYDIVGRRVRVFEVPFDGSGTRSIELDIHTFPPGLYQVRVVANGQTTRRSVIVIR